MNQIALSPLEKNAMTETYEDVRLLIYRVVHYFVAKSGIDFDSLFAEANYIFVRAYKNYHPERFEKKSKFSSFLYFSLNCELRNFIKKQEKHRGHLEVKEEICGASDHDSFRLSVEGKPSKEALVVVMLLLDSSSDMQVLFRWKKIKTKRGVVAALKEHLADTGWTLQQIQTAFKEIKTVLLHTGHGAEVEGEEVILARKQLSREQVRTSPLLRPGLLLTA